MIRVTVELVPFGDDDKSEVLGQYIIFNEGHNSVITQLNEDYADYQALLQDPIGIKSVTITHPRSAGWQRLLQHTVGLLYGEIRYNR